MSHLALVVEDEAPLRTLYEIVLKSVGFSVVHAADGQQALSLLQDEAPQLVLLDMLLPKVNGSIVLDYLHTAPHLQSTAVVIVSAHREFGQHSNHTQFLLKPIRPEDIKRAVSEVLAVM